MNYCDAEDVSILLGFDSFSASTRPTLTQVNEIISDVTGEIDFVLSGVGITTQPTGTNILARLKMACKFGVASQVGYAAFGNSTGVSGSQPDKYAEKYKEMLEEMKTDSELYGASSGDSTLYIENEVSDGTYTLEQATGKYFDTDYKW